MIKIKWKRSEEGYCESHCGRFKISPKYWGRANPTSFKLVFDENNQGEQYSTQKEAKEKASKLLNDSTI